MHVKHNLASPSCVTDGERVYAWFATGLVLALNLDGELLWKRHLGQERSRFDVRWGHGSSPALYEGSLLLLVDHPGDSYLLAVDKQSGKDLWRADRGSEKRSYTTPFVIRREDGDQLVINTKDRIEAVDPTDGRLLWHVGQSNRVPIAMPIYHDGMLYSNRGYFSAPYLAVPVGGKRDGTEVRYLHVVFTVPRILSQLALQNKRVLYSLLLRTSAATLLEVARDPKRLGAEIGFFSILHTWNQKLQEHAHVHSVVPAGGLWPHHRRWINARGKSFFLPKDVLAAVFRGKFVAGLKKAFADGKLCFYGRFQPLAQPRAFKAFLRTLYSDKWVVELRPPFGGSEQALLYLSRYTHRIAGSNQRLVSLQDGQVTFRWRDSAHGNQQKLMTLSVHEFLRRFLLHVLPCRFVRIRYFGFLAHRKRGALLPLCQRLLVRRRLKRTASKPDQPQQVGRTCPRCGGFMRVVERLSPAQLRLRSPPPSLAAA